MLDVRVHVPGRYGWSPKDHTGLGGGGERVTCVYETPPARWDSQPLGFGTYPSQGTSTEPSFWGRHVKPQKCCGSDFFTTPPHYHPRIPLSTPLLGYGFCQLNPFPPVSFLSTRGHPPYSLESWGGAGFPREVSDVPGRPPAPTSCRPGPSQAHDPCGRVPSPKEESVARRTPRPLRGCSPTHGL